MNDKEHDLANQWTKTCDEVCETMKGHTRPFIAPLSRATSEGVFLQGTGTYISIRDQRLLLTCEHVASAGPLNHCSYGSKNVESATRNFVDSKSLDVAFTTLDQQDWNAKAHQAEAVSFDRFADQHQIADRSELIFIHGFAGENSTYGFDTLVTNASAYVSQQKEDVVADEKIFEVFWEPNKSMVTQATTDQ